MSSSTPTRRRRIAGERKPTRAGTASGRTTDVAPAAIPVPGSEPVGALDPGRPSPRKPAAGEPSAEDGTRVRPAVLVALALVAAVLVAVAAGPFVPGLGLGAVRDVARESEVAEARRAAPAAAERAASAILAYDHRSLEADRDAAAGFMTEDYRERYLDTFDGTVLENASKLKARVRADVRASGVALAEPDRVEVLMFANQTTVSTANGGEPQVALNRVMFTMERSADGAWLVDDITSY